MGSHVIPLKDIMVRIFHNRPVDELERKRRGCEDSALAFCKASVKKLIPLPTPSASIISQHDSTLSRYSSFTKIPLLMMVMSIGVIMTFAV